MRNARRTAQAAALLVAALGWRTAASATESAKLDPRSDQPLVQLALLLDTSNSMDGMIAQAKTQLWKLVNEFARSKRAGKTPRVEVALYEYGNDGLPASSGHIRQVAPLTTDLDLISEKLFSLRTNGGSEYCGQVIGVAAGELAWSPRSALKVIFIAGNEPFTQGPANYRDAVRQAIGKGIIVNTVFCGNEREGIATGWRDGALLADGRYTFIDSSRQVAAVVAPQDAELARLNQELNSTYVGYGAKGKQAKARQAMQDKNAEGAGQGAAVQRAMAKSSSNYRNDDWDLVDAARSGTAAPAAMAADELPAEMQGMDGKQREEYVQRLSSKRSEIQTKMQKLEAERRAQVAGEEKKRAASGEATMDKAMLDAIHEQGAKADFKF